MGLGKKTAVLEAFFCSCRHPCDRVFGFLFLLAVTMQKQTVLHDMPQSHDCIYIKACKIGIGFDSQVPKQFLFRCSASCIERYSGL